MKLTTVEKTFTILGVVALISCLVFLCLSIVKWNVNYVLGAIVTWAMFIFCTALLNSISKYKPENKSNETNK